MPPPVGLIARSFHRLLGRPLVEGIDVHSCDAAVEAAMQDTTAVIVAHGTEPDPIFFYGNRAALRLFEATREQFTAMPSRLSAEPMLREERERLLARVRAHSYIDDYSGVRISLGGRRFRIARAIVWNLIDERGKRQGQAATFTEWTPLDS